MENQSVSDEDVSVSDAGDTTICVDEVEETLDNGETEGEFNFAAALALRKNLSAQFDKHAEAQKDEAAPVQKVSGVKSKIACFETKNKENGSKVRFKTAKLVRAMPKPPRVPVSGPAVESTSDLRLSVYLRIRPPLAGVDPDSEGANTVEILDAGKQSDGRSTMIRAYPPHDSNAAKAVRSKHQLHGHSGNTDLVFGSSGEEGRGVREYEFSEVFDSSSKQPDVYDGVAAPLVEGLFPSNDGGASDGGGKTTVGQSALLFAYGVTNAGKTYTIMGDGDSGNSMKESSITDLHQNRGIMPRALHDILRRIRAAGDHEYQLNMSYFEIYNEQVFDLLVDADKDEKSTDQAGPSHRRPSHHHSFGPVALKLRETREGKIIVRGLKKHRVSSVAEGLELANVAKNKRHTSSNNINSDSSRSHCICQLELSVRPGSMEDAQPADDASSVQSASDSVETSVKGKDQRSVALWIVDLAGSERSKRTGTLNKSIRQKEAALINSSLMKLTRCLQTLRNNQLPTSSSASTVPFRESKLTHLFMNHLTGASASRTSMIVNINPSAADYDETQHVLAYATVARSVVISESDFNHKRQALMAASSSQPTHGSNGRLIKSGKRRSPPRKIARLASKLSPRSMLAKRREQQDVKVQKRKAEVQSTRAAAATSSRVVGGPNKKLKSSKTAGTYRGKPFLQGKSSRAEVEKLRSSLAEANEQVERLQTEAVSLKTDAADRAAVEAEIRMEVSEEMDEQMQSMREQYTTIINRLKTQVKTQPTPGKSTRKVKLDKAEEYIEELMEKVDECEEEMERMRDLHKDEITTLRKAHEEALAAKSAEIASVKDMHDAELEKLVTELETCQQENEELHDMLQEEENEDAASASYDEDDPSDPGPADEGLSPTPSRVRRLRRERCSEVACANVASPSKDVQSSSKKKRGGLRILRNKVASSSEKVRDSRQPLTAMENVPRTGTSGTGSTEVDDALTKSVGDDGEEYGPRRSRRLDGQ